MATNNKRSGLLIQKDQLKQKWAFQFLIVCVLLAALIFGLMHAVMYFSSPARAQLAAPLNVDAALSGRAHQARLSKRLLDRPLAGQRLALRAPAAAGLRP